MLLINTLPRMALQNLTRISSVQCQALFHRNQRMKEVLPNMSAFFLQRPAFREHSRHSNIASFLSFLKDDVLCPLCGGIRDSCGDRAAGCRVLGTGYHDARSPTFFCPSRKATCSPVRGILACRKPWTSLSACALRGTHFTPHCAPQHARTLALFPTSRVFWVIHVELPIAPRRATENRV